MIRKRVVSGSRRKNESQCFLLDESKAESSYRVDVIAPYSIRTTEHSTRTSFQMTSPNSKKAVNTSATSTVSSSSSSSSASSKGLKTLEEFNKMEIVPNNASTYDNKSKMISFSHKKGSQHGHTNPDKFDSKFINDPNSNNQKDIFLGEKEKNILNCQVNVRINSEVLPENQSINGRRGRVAKLAQMFSNKATTPKIKKNDNVILTVRNSNIETKNHIKENFSSMKQNLLTTKQVKPKIPDSLENPSTKTSLPVNAWPETQDEEGHTIQINGDEDNLTYASMEDEEQVLAANKEMSEWVEQIDDELCESLASDDNFQDTINEETEENADFHLAAVVAEAMKSSDQYSATNSTISNGSNFRKKIAPFKEKFSDNAKKNDNFKTQRKTACKSSYYEPVPFHSKVNNREGSNGRVLNIKNLFDDKFAANEEKRRPLDPWDVDGATVENESVTPSRISMYSPSSIYSSPSNDKEVEIDLTESRRRVLSSGKSICSRESDNGFKVKKGLKDSDMGGETKVSILSIENLAAQNKLTTFPKPINGSLLRGYKQFIDKAMDVPNLIDNEESTIVGESSEYNTTPFKDDVSKGKCRSDIESDVFDGISLGTPKLLSRGNDINKSSESDVFDDISTLAPSSAIHESPHHDLSLVRLKSQVTKNEMNNRNRQFSAHGSMKKHNNNDLISQKRKEIHHYSKATANINKNRAKKPANLDSTANYTSKNETSYHFATETEHSSIESNNTEKSDELQLDLSVYYVQPSEVRKLVRVFRRFCRYARMTSGKDIEDIKKSFALFEMRSRVMETDIERGLRRKGGTDIVDDIVLTQKNRTAMRIRDALIVSKAWRDGAVPRDAFTASLLTRRKTHSYRLRRFAYSRLNLSIDSKNKIWSSNASTFSNSSEQSQFRVHHYYEDVRWVDDHDFALLQCFSLGPRRLHGVEMFTHGDCQSLLLKLTNEQCISLKNNLAQAKIRQTEAEELMNEEAISGFDSGYEENFMMTKAEAEYLDAMEEVKICSRKLILAERSFKLVWDRIENLVSKYESLLIDIDESSTHANSTTSISNESIRNTEEKELLVKRVEEAEMKAEVSAREAKLAKEAVSKIKEEKERELFALNQRLTELESRSSTEREYAVSDEYKQTGKIYDRSSKGESKYIDQYMAFRSISESDGSKKSELKEKAKAKFRSRNSLQKHRHSPDTMFQNNDRNNATRKTSKLNGEEMYQHLHFYERSLKSVSKKNGIYI